MAAKPTVLPRWIATGQTVAPSTLKEDSGYAPGEQPPSQYENYHKAKYYEWLAYLDDLEGNAHAWTAQNSFTNLDKAHLTTDFKRLTWGHRVRYFKPGMESNGSSVSVVPPTPPSQPGSWACPGAGTYDLYVPLPMDENEYLKALLLTLSFSPAVTATFSLEAIASLELGAGSSTATVIGKHTITANIGSATAVVDGSSTPTPMPPVADPSTLTTGLQTIWAHANIVVPSGTGLLIRGTYVTGRGAV